MNKCIFSRQYPRSYKRFLARAAYISVDANGGYHERGTREARSTHGNDDPNTAPFQEVGITLYYCPECRKRFLMQEAIIGRPFTELEKKLYWCHVISNAGSPYYQVEHDTAKEAMSALGFEKLPPEMAEIFSVGQATDVVYKGDRMQCPHCHYTLCSKDAGMEGVQVIGDYESVFPISESVWKNEEKGTVTYERRLLSYTPGRSLNDPWISKISGENLTVNTRTKRLYIWTKQNGKKRSGEIYGCSANTFYTFRNLCGMAECCPAFLDSFPGINIEADTASDPRPLEKLLALSNRLTYPMFPDAFHKQLLGYQSRHTTYNNPYSGPAMAAFLRRLKRLRSAEDVLRYAAHRLHVPARYFSKKDRKAILGDPMMILAYETGIRLGITDHNIIRNNKEPLLELFWHCPRREFLFLRDVFAKRWNSGELRMLQETIAKDWGILTDSVRMYNRIKEEDPGKMPPLRGNIKDIHDALTDAHYKMTNKDESIPYEKDEIGTLENTQLGYTFFLPRSTSELWDAGRSLHNCVVSYSQDALQKRRDIVLAAKTGQPEICIELAPVHIDKATDAGTANNRKPAWALMQAKSRFNRPLNEEQAAALFQYMNACGISGNDCYDFCCLVDEFCKEGVSGRLTPPMSYGRELNIEPRVWFNRFDDDQLQFV